jgi:hypothetical protein
MIIQKPGPSGHLFGEKSEFENSWDYPLKKECFSTVPFLIIVNDILWKLQNGIYFFHTGRQIYSIAMGNYKQYPPPSSIAQYMYVLL